MDRVAWIREHGTTRTPICCELKKFFVEYEILSQIDVIDVIFTNNPYRSITYVITFKITLHL